MIDLNSSTNDIEQLIYGSDEPRNNEDKRIKATGKEMRITHVQSLLQKEHSLLSR